MTYRTATERAVCVRETEDTPAASAAMAPGPNARAGRHVWWAVLLGHSGKVWGRVG